MEKGGAALSRYHLGNFRLASARSLLKTWRSGLSLFRLARPSHHHTELEKERRKEKGVCCSALTPGGEQSSIRAAPFLTMEHIFWIPVSFVKVRKRHLPSGLLCREATEEKGTGLIYSTYDNTSSSFCNWILVLWVAEEEKVVAGGEYSSKGGRTNGRSLCNMQMQICCLKLIFRYWRPCLAKKK